MKPLLFGQNQVAYSDMRNLTGPGLGASRVVLGGHGDVSLILSRVGCGAGLRREFSGISEGLAGPLTRTLRDA